MAKRIHLAAGLDIGSTWTRLVLVSVEDGLVHYNSHASVLSQGWRRGQIADQSAVAVCIQQVIEEAQRRTGQLIGSAVAGIGGPSIRCQQGRGVYDFGPRRRVQQDDIVQALKFAAQCQLDQDRLLLQVLPQDFTLDGRPPVLHPLNVECERLEAHALLITASRQEHQTLLSSVQKANVQAEESIFEAMAAAYASILPEERAGGVALVDIGAQSCNIVFYDGDALLFAAGLPISGEHFTRDLCELKSLSFDEAERLKLAHGCALLGFSADNIIIELPPDGARAGREISRRDVIEILEARATQLFDIVEHCRRRYARDLALREGVVLCGGGAQLEGLVELAERVMNCPARLGLARGILDWPDELQSPLWTTAAGLAMYSARLQFRREISGTSGIFNWIWGK